MKKDTFEIIFENCRFDDVQQLTVHLKSGDRFQVDMNDIKIRNSFIAAIPANMDEGTVFIPYEEISYISI